MKRSWSLYETLNLFGVVSLFGGLIWSVATNDTIYFALGYPVAVGLLIVSGFTRPLE